VAASVGNGGNKLAIDLKLFTQPRQIHAHAALLMLFFYADSETTRCILTGDR
jgi:hypothetical protein